MAITRVSWRVDDVEEFSAVFKVNDACLDGVFMGFFFFVEVANAGTVIDACEFFDRSCFVEQGVGKGSFPGPASFKMNYAQRAMLRISDDAYLGIIVKKRLKRL